MKPFYCGSENGSFHLCEADSTELFMNPPEHITVVLKECSDLAQIKESLPYLANLSIVSESVEYPLLNEKTTYYICKNRACLPPTNTLKLS